MSRDYAVIDQQGAIICQSAGFDPRRATETVPLSGGCQLRVCGGPLEAENEALRRQFEDGLNKNHAHSANLFGAGAQKAAYTRGDEWLDAVLEYIRENRDFAVAYVNERIPGVTARPQEGTYVMWLDFRGTGLSDDGIRDVLINRAHVALSDGRSFGEEGSGFVRMIIAQPRVSVARILGRIEAALREAQP